MREPITVEQVVSGLRSLALEIELGYRPVPQPGQAMRRAGSGRLPVVPLVVHDALCGWRVASDQEDDAPGVLACAGCGLAYLIDEVRMYRRTS